LIQGMLCPFIHNTEHWITKEFFIHTLTLNFILTGCPFQRFAVSMAAV